MTPEVAERLAGALKAGGVNFITYLPDHIFTHLFPIVQEDDDFTVIRASHEGSAVAIACGGILGGKQSVAVMEASGLVLSLYHTEAVAFRRGLPLVLLASYVGSPGHQANNHTFAGWGNKVEHLATGIGLRYKILEEATNLETHVADVVRAANSAKSPSCLLLTGEFTAPSYPKD